MTIEARSQLRGSGLKKLVLEARDPESGEHHGHLVLLEQPVPRKGRPIEGDPSLECVQDIAELAAEVGRQPRMLWVVWETHVAENHRGEGVGVKLYLSALERATMRGGFLVGMQCLVAGETSTDARRVWEGKRFNKAATRRGVAAVHRHRTPRRNTSVPMAVLTMSGAEAGILSSASANPGLKARLKR